MTDLALIYVTGVICFVVMYPALYDYACMRYEILLKYKIWAGVLLVIFWPLFLLYVLFCVIRNFKIAK